MKPSTNTGDGANASVRELQQSAFQRLEDQGTHVLSDEQHRMHNTTWVEYISAHHYRGAMVDETLHKTSVPQAEFMRKFHRDTYNTDSNILFLVTDGTRAHREKGGTSLINDTHAAIIIDYVEALLKALDAEEDLGFDKTELATLYLSTYLAQVANLTHHAKERGWLKEPKMFQAHTIGVAQGLHQGVVIRDILNYKLSTMAGNRQGCLVADTRFKYAYVVVMTTECVDHKTYDLANKALMFRDGRAKHIYGIYHLATKNNWVHNIESLVTRCSNCDEENHMAADCPYGKTCDHCGSNQHVLENCTAAPFKAVSISGQARPCKRCKSTDHQALGCPHPWCKICKTSSHTYEDCPDKSCKKCNVKGHCANEPACPKYEVCKNCGGPHLTKRCTQKVTKASKRGKQTVTADVHSATAQDSA